MWEVNLEPYFHFQITLNDSSSCMCPDPHDYPSLHFSIIIKASAPGIKWKLIFFHRHQTLILTHHNFFQFHNQIDNIFALCLKETESWSAVVMVLASSCHPGHIFLHRFLTSQTTQDDTCSCFSPDILHSSLFMQLIISFSIEKWANCNSDSYKYRSHL